MASISLTTLFFIILGIGCVNSVGVAVSYFIEAFMIGMHIWDIGTDIKVLVEMKRTQNKYDSQKKQLQTSPHDYDYEFCFPTHFVPKWYLQMPNTTMSGCECQQSVFNCPNTTSVQSDDIVCETQIFGYDQPSQQILEILTWECEACQCNDSGTLYSPLSLPVQRLYSEYDTMKSLGLANMYCDPYSIVNDELNKNDNLAALIKSMTAFLVIGIIAYILTTILRFAALVNVQDDLEKANDNVYETNADGAQQKKWIEVGGEELTEEQSKEQSKKQNNIVYKQGQKEAKNRHKDNAERQYEASVALFAIRSMAGFLANLFHDIPEQIVALLYLKFLYTDYGYECYSHFVDFPSLSKTQFNTNEDIWVIFAKNPFIIWSVTVSFLVVIFNATYQIYAYVQEVSGAERSGARTFEIEWFNEPRGRYAGWKKCCRRSVYYLGLLIVCGLCMYFRIGVSQHMLRIISLRLRYIRSGQSHWLPFQLALELGR